MKPTINCFFDNSDVSLRVIPKEFIKSNQFGYYTIFEVGKSKVADLIRVGVLPEYVDNKFILKVTINNNSKITLNDIRISDYSIPKIKCVDPIKLEVLSANLRPYSINTNKIFTSCYAKYINFGVKSQYMKKGK